MSYGIDIPIARLVADFTAQLWTGKTVSWNGRVFRNERNERIIPEVYDSTNKRYTDVLLDRTKDAICFFDVNDQIRISSPAGTATVKICFAVNLVSIYSSNERQDERAHMDVLKILKQSAFRPVRLLLGFEGFSQYGLTSNSKDNMQPYHLFCFETELNYNLLKCE